MRRYRLPLFVGFLHLGLACGPRTWMSTAVPTTYDVVVDLALTTPDGVVRPSRNVTHCDVIDLSDSYLQPRPAIRATGERNAWALPDGSAMVFARVHPCKWGHRVDRPERKLRLVPPEQRRSAREHDFVLRESEVWLFDDAIDPARLDRLDVGALLAGSTHGTVSGTIQPVVEGPTVVLPNLLPFLADPSPDATSFLGMEATMSELVGVSCTSVDPAGQTWVPVEPSDPCARWAEVCDERASNAPCERRLGGLDTAFDADGRYIRFSSQAVDPELLGSLRRMTTIPAAAPRTRGGLWAPDVCIDDACFSGTERGPQLYVLPSRGRRVLVRLNRVDATDARQP